MNQDSRSTPSPPTGRSRSSSFNVTEAIRSVNFPFSFRLNLLGQSAFSVSSKGSQLSYSGQSLRRQCVRVIVMGRNNTHRSKYLYFPPSTAGGGNRQHALEYQDGGVTKQLLSRFKVIEWPVTGLLPNMGGMTGRRMAEHMFGFDNKASDTCKTLIEKERAKV
ncbi:hypothetical protein GPECTOR_245g599 [Gonium pectorale]|uniref:Uncharacterized protein n=1 Tax=Gonium pectorale TaxID=33097 RepID=A0A150FWC5_GONPE|nr:hypothetical protein GPECTOR_245g599 [Gonium pectorale]|eukprot:KXZ41911.1 hypothetical protein GPECTOR_245g599 [Gonium pectorale]